MEQLELSFFELSKLEKFLKGVKFVKVPKKSFMEKIIYAWITKLPFAVYGSMISVTC